MKLKTLAPLVTAALVAANLAVGSSAQAGRWAEETRLDGLSHRSAEHVVLELDRRSHDDPSAIAVSCVRGQETLVIDTRGYQPERSTLITIMTDGRPHKIRARTSGKTNSLYADPNRDLLRDLAKADDIVVGFKDRRGKMRTAKSENTRRGVLLTLFTADCR
ncbi:hypothetical protein [Parasedimentitalea maritima]|uniref:Uncharacterized protein n=1 Tax=Parasedimentitalea maritima TaxID=2578117 RepID=A0A6A4R7H3_9RHOB|nr:hypothetical protein [Zongyanglinia marina]KAE9627381.1 hypothetical protein GP644_19640 [Zongyanglinia marina]